MEGVALAVLLAMFVMVGLNWRDLPQRIPTHYNLSGQPDKWGSKDSVWLLPVVGANLYLLLSALSRLKGTLNVPLGVCLPAYVDSPEAQAETRQFLTAVKMMLVTVFAFITWRRVDAPDQGLGRAFVPLLLLLPLAVAVIYFLRLRRDQGSA